MNFRLPKGLEATYVLIFINTFIFAITFAKGNSSATLLQAGAMFPPSIVINHEYWRFLTAGFLHASPLHLVSNMWSLYIVGRMLEPLFGRESFLGMYFMGILMGNLASFAFGGFTSMSLGASSAIFALFAAVVCTVKLAPNHPGIRLMSQQFMAVILLNLAISFSPGIDLFGHLGGLVGGVFAFYTLAYFRTERAKQIAVFLAFLVACGLLYYYGVHTASFF